MDKDKEIFKLKTQIDAMCAYLDKKGLINEYSDWIDGYNYEIHLGDLLVKAKTKAVKDFYKDVCGTAELNMLKTGKLEGAHYAAMQLLLKDYL